MPSKLSSPASVPFQAPLRKVALAPLAIEIETNARGILRARSPLPLPNYQRNVTERLAYWAAIKPDAPFLAARDGKGWRHLTYSQALTSARGLGQALLDRRLSAERPLVILSGNSIAHARLALAALYVGIPYAPISPAYARVSTDFAKLTEMIAALTAGLVFAEDAAAFGPAIAAAVPQNVEILSCDGDIAQRSTSDFSTLCQTTPTDAVAAAYAKVTGDTLAKILFTSGSLSQPKPVITTHRMLCANQAMIGAALPFLRETPPVLVDWLPWHHSFGGNHNFGIVLQHGGTLYIDQGRPTDAGMAATIAALREIAPTLYFNVPQGYERLLPHLARDAVFAENFFRSLQLTFFAGASLSAPIVKALDEIALASCGERIGMISGFGATETAPSVLFQTDLALAGQGKAHVGLPLPGNELKLAPVGDKYELRVKGPHVTPGYWRNEALTRAAFDEEDFYRLGDALRLADPHRPAQGFIFEGRLGEDFKLASGTTVAAGPLRARLLKAGAPYISDAAIAGEGRDAVIALVFPDCDRCKSLAPDLPTTASPAEILRHPKVVGEFRRLLGCFAETAGGASQRIRRLALLAEPPSLDRGEITDKGTLNRAAVLARHADIVDALYAGEVEIMVGAQTPAPRLDKAS